MKILMLTEEELAELERAVSKQIMLGELPKTNTLGRVLAKIVMAGEAEEEANKPVLKPTPWEANPFDRPTNPFDPKITYCKSGVKASNPTTLCVKEGSFAEWLAKGTE